MLQVPKNRISKYQKIPNEHFGITFCVRMQSFTKHFGCTFCVRMQSFTKNIVCGLCKKILCSQMSFHEKCSRLFTQVTKKYLFP